MRYEDALEDTTGWLSLLRRQFGLKTKSGFPHQVRGDIDLLLSMTLVGVTSLTAADSSMLESRTQFPVCADRRVQGGGKKIIPHATIRSIQHEQ